MKAKGVSRKSYRIGLNDIEDGVNFSQKYKKFSQNPTNRFRSEKVVEGTYITSKMAQGIGKIRLSLDQSLGNEPEDFGLNDTDERVTNQKKDALQRNIDWKKENYQKVNTIKSN